jgi:hypothetical protein
LLHRPQGYLVFPFLPRHVNTSKSHLQIGQFISKTVHPGKHSLTRGYLRSNTHAPYTYGEETVLYSILHHIPTEPISVQSLIQTMMYSSWLLSSRFAVLLSAQCSPLTQCVLTYPLLLAVPIRPSHHCQLFNSHSMPASLYHSLEEVRAHGSLSTIALQAPYALVGRFLTRIKVFAVCLPISH